MCCLFGVLNYGGNLPRKFKNKIISVLATKSEERGIDATGLAYNTFSGLSVYKRPMPAHKLKYDVPNDARFIMGHTRMTTQGSEARNYNNHPFMGTTRRSGRFALAHNGILYNDERLRDSEKLPKTKVQTDSYVAVQLIEQQPTLNFSNLKSMAEKVKGSFTFTVLARNNDLYIVKGDNPFYLLHYPSHGLYLYASTDEILLSAVKQLGIKWMAETVPLSSGDILRIDRQGKIVRSSFPFEETYYGFMWRTPYRSRRQAISGNGEHDYLETLKTLAPSFGYSPDFIESLFNDGFECDEIEDFISEPRYGGRHGCSENDRYWDGF